jgi:hypothetical protein
MSVYFTQNLQEFDIEFDKKMIQYPEMFFGRNNNEFF